MKALLIELSVCLVTLSWSPCFSFCASQEAPLHEELHPHASVCVIHPEGHRRVHQGCRPLRSGRGGQLLHGLREFIIQGTAVFVVGEILGEPWRRSSAGGLIKRIKPASERPPDYSCKDKTQTGLFQLYEVKEEDSVVFIYLHFFEGCFF